MPGANPGSACAGDLASEAVRQRVARFERAWPDLHGALQQRASVVGLPAVRQDGGELEVGVEIVRVGGEFFAEGLGGAIGVAGEEQRLAVVRLERGHVRIECHGLGKLRGGGRDNCLP